MQPPVRKIDFAVTSDIGLPALVIVGRSIVTYSNFASERPLLTRTYRRVKGCNGHFGLTPDERPFILETRLENIRKLEHQ